MSGDDNSVEPECFGAEGRRSHKLVGSYMNGSQSTSTTDDLRPDPSFTSWKRSWAKL